MDGGVWWLIFQRLKVLSMAQEKMRGASDVSMSKPRFTMNVNSPSCPCKKNTPLHNLCANQEVSFEHLFVCLLHRFSLCARVAHVGERVQMVFSKRSQMPSHASLCEHCSLSPSSAKEAVPVWREVFISSFRDLFSHHCSERLHGTWMMRVPSIPFCPLFLSIRVPFE